MESPRPTQSVMGLRAAPASPQVSATLWVPTVTTLGKGHRGILLGRRGQNPGVQAPTHRYVEADISLVQGHSGRVEACRLHGDGAGKKEKNNEGGHHEADEHRQEHGELPVGEQEPGWRSLNPEETQARGV